MKSKISNQIKLSVVVCTYNRSKLLTCCMRSLLHQTINKDYYEIVIVNNNSTDETIDIAKSFIDEYRNIRLIDEPKQGLSNARNTGWRNAYGEYVAYIDDDARANPEWCNLIVNAFEIVTPKPVAVGGEIRPIYEATPPEWFTDDFEIRTWGEKALFLQSSHAKHGFSGSNMAFCRSTLEEFGGFNPDYGMQGTKMSFADETELFMRIYARYPLFWYDPSILVCHWTPKRNITISYRLKRSFQYGKASAQMEKRKVLPSLYLLKWLGFLFYILKSLIQVLRSNNKKKCFVKLLATLSERLGYLLG